MKNSIILVAAVAIISIFAISADAVFVAGTAPGAVNVGGDGAAANSADTFGDVLATYTNSFGADTKSEAPAVDGTNSVIPIYGDTIQQQLGTLNGSPGDSLTFTIWVTNWSSQSDSIGLSVDTGTLTGASSGSVAITVGAVDITNGIVVAYTPNLGPGAATQVIVDVAMDTGADGIASFQLVAKANAGAGGDAGGYTAFGNNFAGFGDDSTTLTVSAAVADINILVAFDTANAPSDYNGGANDIVPGATIRFAISYDNDGSDSAGGVVLNTYIPANSTFDSAGGAMATLHTGGTLTVAFYSDTGGLITPVGSAVGNPAVRRVEWTLAGSIVAPNNGDGDTYVDGTVPDVDAGKVSYQVRID